MALQPPDLAAGPEARAALKADPRGFLARHGVEVPPGTRIEVHENTATVLHLVLLPDWREHLPERGGGSLLDVLRRAASEPSFKARLLASPTAVFAQYGVRHPEGTTVRLHEADGSVLHVVLPEAQPQTTREKRSDDISDGDA